MDDWILDAFKLIIQEYKIRIVKQSAKYKIICFFKN